jgi:thiol-disulfide isomerase/thioredoxin
MLFNFSIFSLICLGLILFFGLRSDVYLQSNPSSNVKLINVPDLELILEEGKGSAILINVWATWCEPCREEFPDLVKLSDQYKKNIRFIGISADDIDDLSSKVIPFLKKQNAQFENYLIKVSEPEDFIDVLDSDWSGAIPATFIYDKNGQQTEVLIGKQSYEEFANAIKKVID